MSSFSRFFPCWFLRLFGLPCAAPAAIRDLRVTVRRKKVGGHMTTTATAGWTPPSVDTNGDALPPGDIASFQIFDAVNGAAPALLGSAPAVTPTFTTPPLIGGTHVFTVTSTDVAGNVSPPSNAVSVVVQLTAPAAISDLTVTLNLGVAAPATAPASA